MGTMGLRRFVAALMIIIGLGSTAARAEKIHHRAGTSSASFLKVPVGARPVAMGEAFTAVADDLNALYWNPAGLAGQGQAVIGVTHQEAYEGLQHEFVGFAQPTVLRPGGRRERAPYGQAWGVGLIILNVPGDLERRSGVNEGGVALGQITSPEGTFGATDMALGGSYAFQANRDSWGASARYIRQAIDNHVAQTGALDLGWKRAEVLPNLTLGAALLNLGPGLRFRQNWYPLPLTPKVGAAYRLERWRTTLAMDVAAPRDDFPILAWGGEAGLTRNVFWRAGYRYRWHGNPLGTLSGFRTGLGVAYKNLTLDYAVAPFGELGNSHRVSMAWKFGRVYAEPAPESTPAAPGATTGVQGPSDLGAAVPPPPAAPEAPAPETPATPVPAPPPPELPMPEPEAQAAGPILDYARYEVRSVPKTVSARGTDFLIQASASDPALELQGVEFRVSIPSAAGLTVEASQETPAEPLPFGTAGKVHHLRLNIRPAVRSVVLKFRVMGDTAQAASPPAFMGRVNGEWQPLQVERIEEGGAAFLKVSSDRWPASVAVIPSK